MQARYERNIPALSEQECLLLRGKKVFVAGCGGLGGHIIENLARIGVGSIICVDGDTFDESNLNRQLLSEMDLLGKAKAEAAAERIRRINPDVRFQAEQTWITEENVHAFISGCDAVLDALDSIPARKMLARACARANIPFIHGAIRGWVAQAAISMPGDGLMEILYPETAAANDKSVLSFTPALCASMQAALCVKLLCGRPVESGKLYYFDLQDMDFEAIDLA